MVYKSVLCPQSKHCVQLWSSHLQEKKNLNGKVLGKNNEDNQSYGISCPRGMVEPEKKDNVEQKWGLQSTE